MGKYSKNIVLLICLMLFCVSVSATDKDPVKSAPDYFNFPKSYDTWQYKFLVGASITKLPTQIVEEEINTSPVVFGDFRLGLPLNFSTDFHFASNYISNIGTLGLQWDWVNSFISLAPGVKGSMWFGHVEMESIRLKSYGMLVTPYISAGVDFGDLMVAASIEMQYSHMFTFSEDSLLAEFDQPKSGLTFRITIEQPFFKDQWVLVGLALHYSTFYYQSWLSYSALKQYLLYPEFYFGFIL